LVAHKKNQCKSYKCPYCGKNLVGIHGVYRHSRKCKLFARAAEKYADEIRTAVCNDMNNQVEFLWLYDKRFIERAFNDLTDLILAVEPLIDQ
jgi:hypothetical protein